MSHFHNEASVSPEDLTALPGGALTMIDVRKPAARAVSGLAIAGSVWRHPFDAANWADEFKGGHVVVYCVHGHEVSQAVRGYLRDVGVDAQFLAGGFEAWAKAGLPVEPVGDADA